MKVKIGGETKDVLTLWREGQTVKMIDQRLLPHRFEIVALSHHGETAQAIRDMVTRGAGAIGCAAGYAMAQAALEAREYSLKEFAVYMAEAADTVRRTRPTAVNLFRAVERCLEAAEDGSVAKRVKKVEEEADKIACEDLEASRLMGEHGEKLVGDGYRILTHCNAGALATVDWGTALAPIREAWRKGKEIFVYVSETRPRLQGMKLTAFELLNEGIPHAIIPDGASGHFMREGVDLIIVGADRIAANGDFANKIGTYEKAVLAKELGVPFYTAAPLSTFDLSIERGEDIPIEYRGEEEVTMIDGAMIAPIGSKALNPGFDVTPSKYLSGVITENGVLDPKDIRESLKGARL